MVLIFFLGNVAGSLQKTRSIFLRMVSLSRSRFECRHASLLPTNCEEERCVTTLKTPARETNSWLNFTRVYIEPNILLVPLIPDMKRFLLFFIPSVVFCTLVLFSVAGLFHDRNLWNFGRTVELHHTTTPLLQPLFCDPNCKNPLISYLRAR